MLPQVISTSGDTHLGGEDFDQRIMEYFIKLIKKKYKTDISGDNRALSKLRREAERAKRALSSQHQVSPAPVPWISYLISDSVFLQTAYVHVLHMMWMPRVRVRKHVV